MSLYVGKCMLGSALIAFNTNSVMDFREDYFGSPTTKSLEPFYTGPQRLGGEDIGTSHQHLYNSFTRDFRSPFSAFSPVFEEVDNTDSNPVLDSASGFKQVKGKINFEDSQFSQEQFKTPKKSASEPIVQQTTASKKYHLRVQDGNNAVHIGKDSERGLRALSKQSFEILKRSEALTYQEVAAKIIEENDQSGEHSEKEKQSIKRRVYDALNVLIAVGVLEKNGKKISIVQNNDRLHSKFTKKNKIVEKKEKDIKQKEEYIKILKEKVVKTDTKFLESKKEKPEQKLISPVILAGPFDGRKNKYAQKM